MMTKTTVDRRKPRVVTEVEHQVFEMYFNPIRVRVEKVAGKEDAWRVSIHEQRGIIPVGIVTEQPKVGFLLDAQFTISVRRVGTRISIVKRIYGKTRRGWTNKPFVEAAVSPSAFGGVR